MTCASSEGERADAIAVLGQIEGLLAALRQLDDTRLQDFAITAQAQLRALLIVLEVTEPPNRMLRWL